MNELKKESRLPRKFILSPLYKEGLFNKDLIKCLIKFGNTIYSYPYYKKAMEYYNNDQALLEQELSRVCDFDVKIREARSDLIVTDNVTYLSKKYYIVESVELMHSKSMSNLK